MGQGGEGETDLAIALHALQFASPRNITVNNIFIQNAWIELKLICLHTPHAYMHKEKRNILQISRNNVCTNKIVACRESFWIYSSS